VDERTRSASPEDTSPELFMLSGGIPRTREDFITHLPSKPVADRLISRYLTSDAVALRMYEPAVIFLFLLAVHRFMPTSLTCL
jgi:hypothetical protein